ncbi:hypothetical protein DFH06DRAFT_1471284 [Mycena polygramma]|nr:hypothetical protein DFH06DRAFT_1471284 [Mycena polygramma]
MASARIVSVFGATGLQGAAVARALLKDGTFSPRAITRNPNSEAALKLKAEGIEVVKGDPLDRASLTDALRGSEAVFGVTAIIMPVKADGPNELVQGINMVDAAKEAGVKFFIFTSLPSLAKASGGKYKNALHYEQKAEVEEYLRASGLPHASLHLGSFLENYWAHGVLQKTPTGFSIAVPYFQPSTTTNFTWVEHDVSAVTLALLKNYADASKGISGKVYTVLTERVAYETLAGMTGKVLGAEVCFTTAPPTGLLALDEMFQSHAEHNIYEDTTIPNPELVELGVKFGTIHEFLEREVKPRFG